MTDEANHGDPEITELYLENLYEFVPEGVVATFDEYIQQFSHRIFHYKDMPEQIRRT